MFMYEFNVYVTNCPPTPVQIHQILAPIKPRDSLRLNETVDQNELARGLKKKNWKNVLREQTLRVTPEEVSERSC